MYRHLLCLFFFFQIGLISQNRLVAHSPPSSSPRRRGTSGEYDQSLFWIPVFTGMTGFAFTNREITPITYYQSPQLSLLTLSVVLGKLLD
ncbi:MAG: hypothetical protein KAR42_08300 [candidate division Zixibacteria bacterium]|nr:hypothetical protein [candidate division Zixibacteria bacterium]